MEYTKTELKEMLLRIVDQDLIAKTDDVTDEIRQHAYLIRNSLIYQAVGKATLLGYDAGIRFDPNDPEWPVLFIIIPVGSEKLQVSWHLYNRAIPYDGESAETYRQRILGMSI